MLNAIQALVLQKFSHTKHKNACAIELHVPLCVITELFNLQQYGNFPKSLICMVQIYIFTQLN